MIFVLENIRSAWNVGAIMRTADALKASVVMVGYTPRPVGKLTEIIHKTALGAEISVPWKAYTTSKEAYTDMSDILHLAIELTPKSQDIYTFLNNPKNQDILQTKEVAIWLGNEIRGIDDQTCNFCDFVIHLPMLGQKESLNVSNCSTAVGYIIYPYTLPQEIY